MKKVGFIGWRGMVGSVLMDRMRAENDFQSVEALFFSTSQVGQVGPDIGRESRPLEDAFDLKRLGRLDIIVTCQGGGYTEKVYPELRKQGWRGYWIDAASTLRMKDDAIIVLDPVNRDVIDQGLASGIKNFIGGNCTVSLMLMALGGLFHHDCVEWLTSMTYQAASGAGANNMRELIAQMAAIGQASQDMLDNPATAALDIDKIVVDAMRAESFPTQHFQVPLAGSLIPWIDRPVENGQSREEWKGGAETNKILALKKHVPIDGVCVRIGTMRCHSQAFTIKLKRDIPLDEIEDMIRTANQWVTLVPNEKEATIRELTPARVSGTLSVPVGRLHKLNIGPEYLTAFSVGDQLMWGAAEPIRRIFNIIVTDLD